MISLSIRPAFIFNSFNLSRQANEINQWKQEMALSYRNEATVHSLKWNWFCVCVPSST